MQTVGGNKKGFIKIQYKRTLAARKISNMVGAPSLQNLKMMTRQSIINNYPVMIEDIEIVDNIFGPAVSTLNGRTTRQKKKVVVDYVLKY